MAKHHGYGGPRNPGGGGVRTSNRPNDRGAKSTVTVYFDPSKSEAELFNELAEKQCDALEKINSNQLRRFFGEIKDLYRRYESLTASVSEPPEREKIYRDRIEPLFKMVRSKVSYATRAGGQSKLNSGFAQMLSEGIQKVHDPDQFRKFVMHLEAVVGFMYGNDKVG